jgi:hypothetical protein
MSDPADTADTVRPGRYRHFKGGEYEVLGVARHSETDEALVVYRPLYGAGGLWVRPLANFRETVTTDGRDVPRFQYLGPAVH